MDPRLVAASALAGYLIGSIQFARIIFARLAPGTDPPLQRVPTKDGQAELVAWGNRSNAEWVQAARRIRPPLRVLGASLTSWRRARIRSIACRMRVFR